MDELFDIFDKDVCTAAKIVSEYEVYVEQQKVKIRILLHSNKVFGYRLSHHYHGKMQMDPYISSVNFIFDSEYEALKGAYREMMLYYNTEDSVDAWKENKEY